MKMGKYAAAIAALVTGVSSSAWGVELVKNDTTRVNLEGQLGVVGSGQVMEDPVRDDARMFLFLQRARLNLYGQHEDYRFRMSMALGGEAEVKAPSPGVALSLLDMYVDVPIRVLGKTYVRAGQFKVPNSRERLTGWDELLFVDRSVQSLGSRHGRDVGAAVFTEAGPVMAAVGVFTGGGMDIPVRDLPLVLGSPLFAGRIGLQTGLDENVFAERERDADIERLGMGVFINGMYAKDSQVGHSSVLSMKQSDKSLLLNANWNPYLTAAEPGELWQVGADAVLRMPAGAGDLSAELEAYLSAYENKLGKVQVAGARAQVSYAFDALPLEAALRYSVLLPSDKFAAGPTSLTDAQPIHQVTPALVYNLKGTGTRLVADAPLHFNAPTVEEAGIGRYLLTNQPDQASYAKAEGNKVTRENVYGARLMLQATF